MKNVPPFSYFDAMDWVEMWLLTALILYAIWDTCGRIMDCMFPPYEPPNPIMARPKPKPKPKPKSAPRLKKHCALLNKRPSAKPSATSKKSVKHAARMLPKGSS